VDREGLPVGIQLLGADFTEGKLFQIAHAFEQVTHEDGWRRLRPKVFELLAEKGPHAS
jgi:Asp-tRNA(Asn)/Glu-tRNA(Gln) amidotransferase A subunit family amidase